MPPRFARALSKVAIAFALLFSQAGGIRAQVTPSLSPVVEQTNPRVVKLFGSGGFRGLNSYGTGILISSDGYILTVYSPLIDAPDLLGHLFDGRRVHVKTVVVEPDLDAALLKLDDALDLPYFDVGRAAARPLVQPGERVLAFSNQFQIATREEPVSVQHGVIAAYSKLHGRRGIFEAPYKEPVYVIDAITNNPGAAGGAVTTIDGLLLGIIGKELRNSLSNTWVNYAVPIQALADFAQKGMKGLYKPKPASPVVAGQQGYHGLILVPDAVERTPPFVDDVIPGSPAAKAGLHVDDLIVYVNGEKINSVREFHQLVDPASAGTSFKLEVRRGDRLLGLGLTLESMPASQDRKE
jgi:serine protease Do